MGYMWLIWFVLCVFALFCIEHAEAVGGAAVSLGMIWDAGVEVLFEKSFPVGASCWFRCWQMAVSVQIPSALFFFLFSLVNLA